MLKSTRVNRHIRKAHGNVFPIVHKSVVHNLAHNLSVPNKKENLLEIINEICPICNGDGGIRGGCYKCGGSGWVSDVVKQNSGLHVSVNKPDLSKVSNANYKGNNVGATFRDRNGRIGSPVEHDDHSDEGLA